MTIGFITDSTCDLPGPILKSFNLHLLPIKFFEGNSEINFNYENDKSRITELLNSKEKITSKDLTPNEIKDFLISLLKDKDYENLICLLPMQTQNNNYENMLKTISTTLVELRSIKTAQGLKSVPKIELIDTQQKSSGLGLIVAESLYRAIKKDTPTEIISRVKALSKYTQTYVIANNLSQSYSKTLNGGFGFAKNFFNEKLDLKPIIFTNQGKDIIADKQRGFDKAFEHVVAIISEHIKNNCLVTNHINMTYSGSLTSLSKDKTFKELEKISNNHNVLLNFTKMNLPMTLNVGLESFSISFAASEIIH